MKRFLLVVASLLLSFSFSLADEKLPVPGPLTRSDTLRLGEAMYRSGILPSGEKMKGVLQGDIALEGPMLTCVNCHLRSGLGTVEGSVYALPVNGKNLYSPLEEGSFNAGLPPSFSTQPSGARMQSPWLRPAVSSRPAYNEKTLADALRRGVDPAGRKLHEAMPRYLLDDGEVEILEDYLGSLSSELSPGVTDTTLRFATIVTEGVSASDREAMLLPLTAYVKIRNSRADVMKSRIRAAKMMDSSFRKLVLDVWELKGAPETWADQMDAYYRANPVFALLGGLSDGEWAPIHRFCEKNKIPSIFPITDLPAISGDDWYTLYFSKGLYREAEAAADYINEMPGFKKGSPVVQVFRSGLKGHALSEGFRDAWSKAGGRLTESIAVGEGTVIDGAFWRELTAGRGDAVFLLWLEAGDLSGLTVLGEGKERPLGVFISSTLVKEKLYSLPDPVRGFTYITYPYRFLQQENKTYTPLSNMGAWVKDDRDNTKNTPLSVEAWLKSRDLKSANTALSSKMFFLTQILSDVLMHMQSNFYRDYFLDVFDMMEDQLISADYPRLSFGPGQRYAAKGCYIVQLSHDEKPALVKKSEWMGR